MAKSTNVANTSLKSEKGSSHGYAQASWHHDSNWGGRNVESKRRRESDLPIKAPSNDDRDLDNDINHDDQQNDNEC